MPQNVFNPWVIFLIIMSLLYIIMRKTIRLKPSVGFWPDKFPP